MTHPALSDRQRDVLRARCQEGSRKAAAALLGITAETVRWHLDQMFERCGCRDDAEACFRHHEEIALAVG